MEGRAVLLLLAGCLLASAADAADDGWTALFNGRDLSNFDIAYSSKPVDGLACTPFCPPHIFKCSAISPLRELWNSWCPPCC